MLLPKRVLRRRKKDLKEEEVKKYIQKHLLEIEQFMEYANISYEETMRGAREIRFFNYPPSFCVFHDGVLTKNAICVQFDEQNNRVTIQKNASCPTKFRVNDSCVISNQQIIMEFQKEQNMLTVKKGEAVQFYNCLLGSSEKESIKTFSRVDEMKQMLKKTGKTDRIAIREESFPVSDDYQITDGFPPIEKKNSKQKNIFR